MFPTGKNSQKWVKIQKSTDKHLSFDGLIQEEYNYRRRTIITRGLYTFYPLFEVHLCTVTFGLMYG
jgi:hypothetical protein